MQEDTPASEMDRLSLNVDKLGVELRRLNAEILYWKSETDKRKLQLGEHLLDDPCDPDDTLWERLAAREVAEKCAVVAKAPGMTAAIIMELVRDKQESLMRLRSRDGTIARLVGLRNALETGYAELERRLWISERRVAELRRGGA